MHLLNAYALTLFNRIFGTNYVCLCRKAQNASLLDYLGPWPVYLLAVELIALAGFSPLSLPFKVKAAPSRP